MKATVNLRSPPATDTMDGAPGAVAAARVTVTVVVADTPVFVATIVTVLAPTDRAIAPDAAPDATAAPFTVSVVEACVRVGVTVTDVRVYGTFAAYEKTPDEKAGDSVPWDSTRFDKVVSTIAAVAAEFAAVVPK